MREIGGTVMGAVCGRHGFLRVLLRSQLHAGQNPWPMPGQGEKAKKNHNQPDSPLYFHPQLPTITSNGYRYQVIKTAMLINME